MLTPVVRMDGAGVVEWFNSEAGRVEVRRIAKGVGTLSVSKSSLAELRIPAHLVVSEHRRLKPKDLIPRLSNDVDRIKTRRPLAA